MTRRSERNSASKPNTARRPAFQSEDEEAEWWYRNRDAVHEDLKRFGRVVPGLSVELTQPITIRIPESDLQRARALAKERGLGYQTFLKELVRAGLELEQRLSAISAVKAERVARQRKKAREVPK